MKKLETVISSNPEKLKLILEKRVQLTIWKRTLPIRFADWISKLGNEQQPNFRFVASLSRLRKILKSEFETCGIPDSVMRRFLLTDIGYLVSQFANITGVNHVDIRLETITHDACWKFHQDFVDVRLLTTYLGPATQWVKPIHTEDALRDQTQFSGPIEHMGIHDVSIFKGSCAATHDGIVHRSPPVANTGQTRVLLCLNKQTKTSPLPIK